VVVDGAPPAAGTHLVLRLFDAQGRLIRTLAAVLEASGQYRVALEGLPPGHYTVLLEGKAGVLVVL